MKGRRTERWVFDKSETQSVFLEGGCAAWAGVGE